MLEGLLQPLIKQEQFSVDFFFPLKYIAAVLQVPFWSGSILSDFLAHYEVALGKSNALFTPLWGKKIMIEKRS